MGIGLLKQTVTNHSGVFTPNALVYGFFDLELNGDSTIAAPTGLVLAQFQPLAFRIVGDPGNAGNVSLGWASAWINPGSPGALPDVVEPGGENYVLISCHNGIYVPLFTLDSQNGPRWPRP